MKSLATGIVLANALCAIAAPKQVKFGLEQQWHADLPRSHPGIDLDLNELRLVQFGDDTEPVWLTELQKIEAKAAGRNFFDITNHPEFVSTSFVPSLASVKDFPALNASTTVFKAISNLDITQPESNLRTFTDFRTRYYKSDTGRQSQLWLLGRIHDITSEFASEELASKITIDEFKHSWGQNSIIAKIPGSNPAGTIIISAHQDSTNMWPFLPAPGADDDGSGSVTILEAYRSLLAIDHKPVNDIEFHWYSAEEGGLLGSQAVAKHYADKKAPVLAMIQFDMTAYVKKGTREEVGVITDFVDPKLVKFVKSLIDEYLDIPYVETLCKYACSDHASWTKAGYPSTFAIESSFENSNHAIHSTGDRMDIPEFSFTHVIEFAKLALGFAIELGSFDPKRD